MSALSSDDTDSIHEDMGLSFVEIIITEVFADPGIVLDTDDGQSLRLWRINQFILLVYMSVTLPLLLRI